jgi:hypothetical protein
MELLNAATNAVSTLSNTLSSSGLASGLSSFTNSLTGTLGSIGSFFKPIPGVKLPLANPLFAYASYDYVIGLGCLTNKEVTNPDTTYMAGKPINLICKSANADPTNRVQTPYGKFDFFIDNLEILSLISLQGTNNTNVTDVSFTVTEPYSMGMFMISLQTIAQQFGWNNFREAPYILTIEFRGNKENGQMASIPGTKRFISINLNDISMKVTEGGAVYTCKAMPYNQLALTKNVSTVKSDVSITGNTVQSILQTGEKSLQYVINEKHKERAKTAGKDTIPDETIILFPQDTASADSNSSGSTESKSSATTSPSAVNSKELFVKLGVARSTLNSTFVQQAATVNVIGRADLGFNDSRKGDTPVGKDNKIWDSTKQVFVRSNNTIDVTVTDMKFAQDSDIPNIINQVILNSKFVIETLDARNLTKDGFRNWWRIDVQTYPNGPVQPATGKVPYIYVYRVVPYEAHASKIAPPNTKPPGIDNLKKQAVKEYNYIYTGKNVDIIRFDIFYDAGFVNVMGSDALDKSQDAKTAAQSSTDAEKTTSGNPLPVGNLPTKGTGEFPTAVSYVATRTSSDKKGGGGGKETPGHRAAKLFMDAVTSTRSGLVNLDMEIIGDPYFIVQSGLGNYTSQSTQYKNLNLDGSVNYQNGEVDILVNFRTPIDINQTTGLYTFTGSGKSVPVLAYSGLYQVTDVTSTFRNGQFKQKLVGMRRQQQENPVESTPDQTLSTSTASVDTKDPYGYGENE